MSKNKELISYTINQYEPMVLMAQETLGFKGHGYKLRKKQDYVEINNMFIASNDPYGITSIYVNKKIKDYVSIHFPMDLFGELNQKYIIHASAVIIFINGKIRNRDYIIYVSVYRSPHKDAISLNAMEIIIKYIQKFVNDKNPNIIIGGDLNCYHENIGSNPLRRYDKNFTKKFIDGDTLFEIMNKYNLNNINDGSPTLWKYQKEKDIMNVFCVDTIWCNNQLSLNNKINATYNSTILDSDHFPGIITLNAINMKINVKNTVYYTWNFDSMNNERWKIFRNSIKTKIKHLENIIEEYKKKKVNKIKANDNEVKKRIIGPIMHSSLTTMKKIIINTGIEIIGRTKTKSNDKKYITKPIKKIIHGLYKLKKKIKPIINRIKKLKIKHYKMNEEKFDINKLKDYLSKKEIALYHQYKLKEKDKNKIIRNAKKKWINNQFEKLITNTKGKNYYYILNKIMNINNGNNDRMINNIIKPSIHVNPINEKQKNELKYYHFTRNSKQIANEMNAYFNTIGTKYNPNIINNTANRHKARRFDVHYDLNKNNNKYIKTLNELLNKFNKSELLYVVTKKLKNNKKTFDYDDENLHVILIKNCINEISN